MMGRSVVLIACLLGLIDAFTCPSCHHQADVSFLSLARNEEDPLLSLNKNLNSLAKSKQPRAAPRAQELLERIEALHQEGYYALPPDVVSLNSVLKAWANSDEPDAPHRALDFLVEQLQDKEPNLISFNTVLMAFARRGAAEDGRLIFDKMESQFNIVPDTISYNTLLYAYAQSNQPQEAENLLREMIKVSTESAVVNTDSISFNTVLLAWANSKHKGAAKKAEDLFNFMENLYEAGNKDVAPDIYSCTTVIQALSAGRDRNAARRALEFIENLEIAAVKRPELTPNSVAVTCVIAALSKKGYPNAAQHAEKLLVKMIQRYEGGDKDCKPDAVAFTALLGCIARSGDKGAGDKALKVLAQMKKMAKRNSDMEPTAWTYTNVLKAVAGSPKAGACEMALQLLDEMEGSTAAPTTIHYNVVLDGIAKSSNPDMATRANELFQQMLTRKQTQPTIITFNSVLRACASTNGDGKTKDAALVIASKTFQSMVATSGIRPSSITFVFLLKSIRRLMPRHDPNRVVMLVKSFRNCCRLGLLNKFVWQQMQTALSEQQLLSLLIELNIEKPSKSITMQDMPVKWTKNAMST